MGLGWRFCPALPLSSAGLGVSSSSFGSAWISKKALSRAEPQTWVLSPNQGAGWGELCILHKPLGAPGSLVLPLFPSWRRGMFSRLRAQHRCVSIRPTRSSCPPVFPQHSPRAKPPAMNKTLFQISIPFSTPCEAKGMWLFCCGLEEDVPVVFFCFFILGVHEERNSVLPLNPLLMLTRGTFSSLAVGFNKT